MLSSGLAVQRLDRHSQHLLKLLETLGVFAELSQDPDGRGSQPARRSQVLQFSLGGQVPAVAHGRIDYSDSGKAVHINALIVRRGAERDYHEHVSLDQNEFQRRLQVTASVHECRSSYEAGTWTLTEDRRTGSLDVKYEGSWPTKKCSPFGIANDHARILTYRS